MNKMVQTKDVYYEYKTHSEEEQVKAVNGVSLDIKQGEFVVILGRNGSGKSTLARLMNGLLIPKEGTVIIDGLDTREENLVWEIRNTLGLVFQNPDNQIVATTVEEDVAFGPENLGMEPSKIRENIDNALKLVGMSEYMHHSPHMLSGGQKQRIAIAGVLAMEPKCIVLDEATSMLDPMGRHEVLEVLHSLNRDKKITIILITHHMDEAAQADHVLVMQHGELVLQGSPQDIFEKVEAVREAGLDVPQVTAYAYELRRNGVKLPKLPISLV
ncbi:MAG: energy-coupling factor transporter ATPase, partial [Clostridia bacterium]|nr:energy-coupling factor transporter ATPase [Clostridia bacterium]